MLSKKLRESKLFDWIETKYYNITIGIRKIFEWLPIVWRDRDWEYEFFTEKIIYHKLKNLQKRPWGEIFECGWWAKKYLNLCVRLMEEKKRMADCEDELWNSVEHPHHISVPVPNKEELYQLKLDFSSKKAEKEWNNMLKKRRVREEKIHHLIYQILEKRGQGWWD